MITDQKNVGQIRVGVVPGLEPALDGGGVGAHNADGHDLHRVSLEPFPLGEGLDRGQKVIVGDDHVLHARGGDLLPAFDPALEIGAGGEEALGPSCLHGLGRHVHLARGFKPHLDGRMDEDHSRRGVDLEWRELQDHESLAPDGQLIGYSRHRGREQGVLRVGALVHDELGLPGSALRIGRLSGPHPDALQDACRSRCDRRDLDPRSVGDGQQDGLERQVRLALFAGQTRRRDRQRDEGPRLVGDFLGLKAEQLQGHDKPGVGLLDGDLRRGARRRRNQLDPLLVRRRCRWGDQGRHDDEGGDCGSWAVGHAISIFPATGFSGATELRGMVSTRQGHARQPRGVPHSQDCEFTGESPEESVLWAVVSPGLSRIVSCFHNELIRGQGASHHGILPGESTCHARSTPPTLI